jgi:hypothetical protein
MSSVPSKRSMRKGITRQPVKEVKKRLRLPVPRKPSNGELSERALFAKPYVPTSRLDKYVWNVFQQALQSPKAAQVPSSFSAPMYSSNPSYSSAYPSTSSFSAPSYPPMPVYPSTSSFSVPSYSVPSYASPLETDYSMYTSTEPIKTYSRQGS